jgi:hypothetical protein
MIIGKASSCGDVTWMKWMSRPSICVMNCGDRVQPRLEPPEVVLGAPVTHELLHRCELHALRPIRDGLPFGPPRRGEPLTEVLDRLLGDVDGEGSDGLVVLEADHLVVGLRRLGSLSHRSLPPAPRFAARCVLDPARSISAAPHRARCTPVTWGYDRRVTGAVHPVKRYRVRETTLAEVLEVR